VRGAAAILFEKMLAFSREDVDLIDILKRAFTFVNARS
jgi:hypothetical protein